MTANVLRNTNMLTAAFCASVVEPGRYSDGGNLYLNVTSTGATSWLFMYRAGGKRRELGLGSFTGAGSTATVTLAEARIRVGEIKTRMARDPSYDPIDAKRNAREEAKAATCTFKSVFAETIEHESANWSKDIDGNCPQADTWKRSLSKFEALLATPIAKVDEKIVFAALKPVWNKTPDAAERARHRIATTIEFAISTNRYHNANPALYSKRWEANVGRRAGKGKKRNQPSIPYAELPELFAKLVAPAASTVMLGVAFCTLTAVRSSNTRLATWSEIDFAKKLWTIPADKMKIDEREGVSADHIVPLSDAALAILERQKGLHDVYVFPHRNGQEPIGRDALNDKLTDAPRNGGYDLKGKASMHGMRATFRTWANEETHFQHQDLEFVLAHVSNDLVAAYQRGTSVEKRRPIMQAWADYCAGKIAMGALLDNSAVVAFERKAA